MKRNAPINRNQGMTFLLLLGCFINARSVIRPFAANLAGQNQDSSEKRGDQR